MNPELIEKVLSCKSLPSLPAVAVKVIELTQDNNTRTSDLAAAITNDQGLSAKLLRTVNSSFYALRKPCTSIQSAIVMLGFSAVKTLALGFSLVGSMAESKDKGFDYTSYWRRSLLTGVAGKCFARAMGNRQEEESFLGGLLQDIGMIAMHRALGAEYESILNATNGEHRQLVKLELAEFELSHAEVGAMLAAKWKLPPDLAMPIKFHERPSAAPQEYLGICKAVGMGNIAAELLSTKEPAVVLKRMYARAQELCGMTPGEVDELMKSIHQGAKEVAHLLNIDIGPMDSTQNMMDKANEQLQAIQVPFDSDLPADAAGSKDPTTGLPARLIFNRNLVTGFSQATGGQGSFSIAILKVDQFNDLRNTQGVEYAAELMAGVAKLLKTHFDAAEQLVCQFDEERFGVVMARTLRAAAATSVDAARNLVANTPIACKPAGLVGQEFVVTISGGLCTLDSSTAARIGSPDEMVEYTLKALDAAGRAGGACTRIFAPKAAAA